MLVLSQVEEWIIGADTYWKQNHWSKKITFYNNDDDNDDNVLNDRKGWLLIRVVTFGHSISALSPHLVALDLTEIGLICFN